MTRRALLFLLATPAACRAERPVSDFSRRLAAAARGQIGVTTLYDPAYVPLAYPGGDVPADRGVCTDVIVRALRVLGHDLQRLVHEDMAAHFSAYPKLWGLTKTDRHIDHRRVPNLAVFFRRHHVVKPASQTASDYAPGDFVTCTVPRNRPHIMLVSDRTTLTGEPLVIHNLGRGTQEEARLFTFPLTGHFAWKA